MVSRTGHWNIGNVVQTDMCHTAMQALLGNMGLFAIELLPYVIYRDPCLPRT